MRERVLGSPRSASPASSSSDRGDLPDVEDIYDLPTAGLADLEARLKAAISADGATLHERRLHELVRVELSERRGVEEIGLALMGGRFDLERVAIRPATPVVDTSKAPSQLERPRERPAQQRPPAPVLADVPSPSASSRSVPSAPVTARSPSPSPGRSLGRMGSCMAQSMPVAPGSLSTRGSSPLGGPSLNATDPGGVGSKGAFKPTPVNFDFVIGGSSVKRKKLAKPKKKPPEEKPSKQDTKREPARPPLAPGRQPSDARGGARPTAPAATPGSGNNRAPSQESRRNRAAKVEGAAKAEGAPRPAKAAVAGAKARVATPERTARAEASSRAAAAEAVAAGRRSPSARRAGCSGSPASSRGEDGGLGEGSLEAPRGELPTALGPEGQVASALVGDSLGLAEGASDKAEEEGLRDGGEDVVCAPPVGEPGAGHVTEEDEEADVEASVDGAAREGAHGGSTPRELDLGVGLAAEEAPSEASHGEASAPANELQSLEAHRAGTPTPSDAAPGVRQGAAAGSSPTAVEELRPSSVAPLTVDGRPCRVLPSILLPTREQEDEGILESGRDAESTALGDDTADASGLASSRCDLASRGGASAAGELAQSLRRRPSSAASEASTGAAGGDSARSLRRRPISAASEAASVASSMGMRRSASGWECGSEGEDLPLGAAAEGEAGGSQPSRSPRAARSQRASAAASHGLGPATSGGYPSTEVEAEERLAAVGQVAGVIGAGGGRVGGKGRGADSSRASGRSGRDGGEKPVRRPPLPHDALRPREAPRVRNELDLVGLDPKLIERGEVTNYVEHFASVASFFTWGLQAGSEVSRKEHYLREAMQLFQQFCDVIGSLEVQFTDELAPADHATPSATQQALSAMGSRGAGLYGVFLKGIIDKMSDAPAESVPRPPVSKSSRDVCSLKYYKVVQNRTEVYDIVTRVFHRKDGWEELPHGLGLSNSWNLCWTWSKPKLDYSRLCCWQKVNHFPENKHLTRKDCLKRCIDRYTKSSGKHAQYFSICPRTFVLPKEYCLFIECFAKIAEENGDVEAPEGSAENKDAPVVPVGCKPQKTANLWIMKPAGSSRGRGIQVVNDVGSVHYGELTIIQQYISNPFLLGGYKWDMRTYVTVTSFNPLEAFIYKDGFARFTTVPYSTDADDIDNKFVHLTNSSIQRHNEDSMMQGEHGDEEAQARQRDAMVGGTKISFGVLKERLKAQGVDWEFVWARMIEVILKSLCMAEDHIPNQVNSFELFGYDLLLDTNLRVWLIEVNASPSMGQEHLLDEQVKQPLISDTIDLVDPLEFDRRRLAEVLHRRVERKAGAAGGRQQLDVDSHAVLKGQVPRKFGEMPRHMGNYERIAPSDVCESIMRTRSQLFNKQ